LPTQTTRQRHFECAADGGNGRFTYAYGSLLKTETLCNLCTGGVAPTSVCQNGVMDYMMYPAEPLTLRSSVAGTSQEKQAVQRKADDRR
jgi:hypothetical protein